MESLARLVILILLTATMLSLGSGVLISTMMNHMTYKILAILTSQVLLYYFSPFPVQINFIFSLALIVGFVLGQLFLIFELNILC